MKYRTFRKYSGQLSIASMIAIAVIVGARHGAYSGGHSDRALPTVKASTFIISTPMPVDGFVGAAITLNASTSWSIIGGDDAGNFSINDFGVTKTTWNGASNLIEDENNFALTVQATNAMGSAANTVTVTAYNDGAQGAPVSATAPGASILASEISRPPWKVAGVDYGVGPPDATSLADWQSVLLPDGCTRDNGPGSSAGIFCSSGDNTFDAVDFTTHGGGGVHATGGSLTVINSKFLMGANNTTGVVCTVGTVNCVAKFNTIDGGAVPFGTSLIVANSSGLVDVEYNYLRRGNQHVIEMEPSDVSPMLIYKYNYIENIGSGDPRSHVNYSQFGGSVWNSVTIAWNTVYQTKQNAGGEGFQLENCCGGSITFQRPRVAFNTIVTSGNAPALSYLFHIGNQTGGGVTTISNGVFQKNYLDDTATLGGIGGSRGHAIGGGVLYRGTAPGMECSGNIMMQNGAIFKGC